MTKGFHFSMNCLARWKKKIVQKEALEELNVRRKRKNRTERPASAFVTSSSDKEKRWGGTTASFCGWRRRERCNQSELSFSLNGFLLLDRVLPPPVTDQKRKFWIQRYPIISQWAFAFTRIKNAHQYLPNAFSWSLHFQPYLLIAVDMRIREHVRTFVIRYHYWCFPQMYKSTTAQYKNFLWNYASDKEVTS